MRRRSTHLLRGALPLTSRQCGRREPSGSGGCRLIIRLGPAARLRLSQLSLATI
jgi:hypothetical protein